MGSTAGTTPSTAGSEPIPARLELWDLEPVGAWAVERAVMGHRQLTWLSGSLQRLLALLAEEAAPLRDDDAAVHGAALLVHHWATDARATGASLERMLLAIGGEPDDENVIAG